MYLTQGIHRAVQIRGGATATVFEGRRQTWREFGERVARLGAGLAALGVTPGDRVAVIGQNSDLYIETVNAIAWTGAVVVPGNFRWSEAEHLAALQDCAPRALIVEPAGAEMGLRLAGACGLAGLVVLGDRPVGAGEKIASTEDLIARHSAMEDACGHGDELCGIYYTGGTTGRSKGVMLSHRNIISNFLSVSTMAGTPEEVIYLHASPLFHIAGASAALGVTLLAGTHVVLPLFTPELAVRAIETERVTWALMVPTMFALLREYLATHPGDLTSVRRIRYGASAISETLLRDTMRLFPNALFQQGYGQTELSPTITLLEPRYHRVDGENPLLRSAGRALVGTDVRIVASDFAEAPRGTVGEIVVRGPGAMLGYWNQPELTAATIVDGWVRTGDAGYMDDDGFIFIADRLKDMIVSGGENVFSAEVENALASHPSVAECAVVGAPDPKWGERVHAIVRLREGAATTAEALIEHCRGLIAHYKCPRTLEIRSTPLPLSPQGKILKAELRKPLWEGETRLVG